RVLRIGMGVPRDLLSWADLQLGDTETRTLAVSGAAFHLIERGSILETRHLRLLGFRRMVGRVFQPWYLHPDQGLPTRRRRRISYLTGWADAGHRRRWPSGRRA